MIMLQSAPVASTATLTESNTGTLPSSTHSPPLPGRTPPTTCVPYSSMRSEWNRPSRPVMPCTTTRVFLFARIAISVASFCSLHCFLGGFSQGLGRAHPGLCQQGPAFFGIGANQADDHGHLGFHLLHGVQDAAGHFIPAGDAAKDIEQHGFDILIGGDDAQSGRHLFGVGASADVQEICRLTAE